MVEALVAPSSPAALVASSNTLAESINDPTIGSLPISLINPPAIPKFLSIFSDALIDSSNWALNCLRWPAFLVISWDILAWATLAASNSLFSFLDNVVLFSNSLTLSLANLPANFKSSSLCLVCCFNFSNSLVDNLLVPSTWFCNLADRLVSPLKAVLDLLIPLFMPLISSTIRTNPSLAPAISLT